MIHDPQELARRFNEDEAVWRSFEDRRWIRRMLGAASEKEAKMLDGLDWLEAEREVRQVRAIGRCVPAPGGD